MYAGIRIVFLLGGGKALRSKAEGIRGRSVAVPRMRLHGRFFLKNPVRLDTPSNAGEPWATPGTECKGHADPTNTP